MVLWWSFSGCCCCCCCCRGALGVSLFRSLRPPDLFWGFRRKYWQMKLHENECNGTLGRNQCRDAAGQRACVDFAQPRIIIYPQSAAAFARIDWWMHWRSLSHALTTSLTPDLDGVCRWVCNCLLRQMLIECYNWNSTHIPLLVTIKWEEEFLDSTCLNSIDSALKK